MLKDGIYYFETSMLMRELQSPFQSFDHAILKEKKNI